MTTFADKAKAERPRRWELLEVAWKGGGGAEPELFELVCNPNAYRCVSVREGGGGTREDAAPSLT